MVELFMAVHEFYGTLCSWLDFSLGGRDRNIQIFVRIKGCLALASLYEFDLIANLNIGQVKDEAEPVPMSVIVVKDRFR